MSEISKLLNKLLEEKNQKLNESDTFGVTTAPATVFVQSDTGVSVEQTKAPEQKPVVSDLDGIKLSAKAFKQLQLAHIAESMINETIEPSAELEEAGLMTEGKMTEAGKKYIKFFPTLFAS